MTLGADLRVLGGFENFREDFLRAVGVFKAAVGEGWTGFPTGQVAFRKAFPGRAPCGDDSFRQCGLGAPGATGRAHPAAFLAFYFQSDHNCVRLKRLGLERNQVFLISISRVHIFQVLTFRF